ncbi:Gfo/Idh/MocA family oxidoreductase [soil metagenome]
MINRRKFILQSVAGAAGITLTSNAFANILLQKKKQKLGVALVGLGGYATNQLAPALKLAEHCFLAGIVTGTPAKAEKWKQLYSIPDKNIYSYDNFDSIANNPDIDVIYVVLPNALHKEFTIRGAKAGKHIWCEKPMAMNSSECQEMINACNANKVKLAIGYRMQHEPNTKKIIQFRKDLAYGKVLKVEANAGFSGFSEDQKDIWRLKKKLGGGAMYDMGVYSLNAARYSTGLEPVAVTATSSTARPSLFSEVDETTLFNLEFPGGVTAACQTSFGKNMNDLIVTCEKGWYKLSPFQAYNGVKGITSDGVKLDAVINNEQTKQMDDDALAIINGTVMMVPGEEGLRDMRVVDAVYKSVAEKKRIVIS